MLWLLVALAGCCVPEAFAQDLGRAKDDTAASLQLQFNCASGKKCGCWNGYCWSRTETNGTVGSNWSFTQTSNASAGGTDWACCQHNSDCEYSWPRGSGVYTGSRQKTPEGGSTCSAATGLPAPDTTTASIVSESKTATGGASATLLTFPPGATAEVSESTKDSAVISSVATVSPVQFDCTSGEKCGCWHGYCWSRTEPNGTVGSPWSFTQRAGSRDWVCCRGNKDCSFNLPRGDAVFVGSGQRSPEDGSTCGALTVATVSETSTAPDTTPSIPEETISSAAAKPPSVNGGAHIEERKFNNTVGFGELIVKDGLRVNMANSGRRRATVTAATSELAGKVYFDDFSQTAESILIISAPNLPPGAAEKITIDVTAPIGRWHAKYAVRAENNSQVNFTGITRMQLSLEAHSGGLVRGEWSGDVFEVALGVEGTGNVVAKGRAQALGVNVNGIGTVDAAEISGVTDLAEITVTGEADVKLNCSKLRTFGTGKASVRHAGIKQWDRLSGNGTVTFIPPIA